MPRIPTPALDELGRWDLSDAIACQNELKDAVETSDRIGRVRRIAGADVSYDRHGDTLYAAVVVLDAVTLAPVETASAIARTAFPYLPGFLSFREAPAILAAFARLARRPDLLLVDGHGLAHPRGLGIACHLGLLLDLPAIGVAKSVLVGEARAPGVRRGSTAPLVHRGGRVGTVVRTRDGVAPVYVSVGHRVGLHTAVRWVLACGAGYRLPEPSRRAHAAVNLLRAGRAAG